MARDLVCFDLDGTVLDPGGSIRASIDHAVTGHGYEAFRTDEVLIGMPLRQILETRTRDPEHISSMVQAFREHYTSDAWRLVRFYDGMEEALDAVRDAGFRTAVVTTKGEHEAKTVLRHLGTAHRFDTVVGDDDARPLKPDPAPVLEACRRMGTAPADACMIGDTSFDIDAGRAAGTHTLGVQWGSGRQWGHPPDGAHALVASPLEILPALRSWAGRGAFNDAP